MSPQRLGYAARACLEHGSLGQWGVYNFEADRWLDIRFADEERATQAATFLTKTRVRMSGSTPE